jgi:hypothetical protein
MQGREQSSMAILSMKHLWLHCRVQLENRILLERMHLRVQDGLYRPDYYQSLMEFRAQTLERMQKFAS